MRLDVRLTGLQQLRAQLAGVSERRLAATLGIASSTVRAVRIGQNWSHLTGRGKLKQHQEGGSDAA